MYISYTQTNTHTHTHIHTLTHTHTYTHSHTYTFKNRLHSHSYLPNKKSSRISNLAHILFVALGVIVQNFIHIDKLNSDVQVIKQSTCEIFSSQSHFITRTEC